MSERKLVTIRKIDALADIAGADFIKDATVDGWNVIVKHNEFQVNDLCVFFEIDSYLNAEDKRFDFLKKGNSPRLSADGKTRIRLKSMKLRGVLSQGLALPLSMFPEIDNPQFDVDYSKILDVAKYERPEPKMPNAARYFPPIISKSDEDRIQNMYGKLKNEYADVFFIPTLKLDGTSTTIAYFSEKNKQHWLESKPEDEFPKSFNIVNEQGVKTADVAVCSRNLQIKIDPESHYFKPIFRDKLVEKVKAISEFLNADIAIQGETMGPRIQDNPEKLLQFEFYAFNIFNIDEQRYLSFEIALELFKQFDIQHVPVLGEPVQVFKEFEDVKAILKHAEGKSINAEIREGIVWKSIGLENPISFKAISNLFLMKVEGKQ